MLYSLRAAALMAFVYGAYCLTLPHTPPKRGVREKLAFRKAFALLRFRSFAVIVLACLPIACIHKIYFIQTAPLLKYLGLKGADIAPAMSIGQFFEIFMIVILGWMLKRLGFRVVLTIGALGYVVRFMAFGTTSLPIWLIIASQAMHGVCFACFYAAAFIYVDRLAEADVRHSAQTVFGILLGIGPVIGGWLNGVLAGAFTPGGGKLDFTGSWGAAATVNGGLAGTPNFGGLSRAAAATNGALTGGTLDYMWFWYTAAAIGVFATLVIALLFRDQTAKEQPTEAQSVPTAEMAGETPPVE
jgi:MFS family permease